MNDAEIDPQLHALFRRHRGALTHPLPAGLRNRLLLSVRPEPRPARLPWLRLGVALAGCLAVVVAFVLGQSFSRPGRETLIAQEVVAGHVRSLMASHLLDVESTDRHTVKPWFEGKLDFAPTVNDLAAQGFPLVGGRVDYIDGRTVAALIYKRNQHVINVYEWPAPEPSDTRSRLIVRRGFQIFTWRQDGVETWVISDLNAGELQTFSDALRVGNRT